MIKQLKIVFAFFLIICIAFPSRSQTVLERIKHDDAGMVWADSVMANMSLREKIGQLFVYTISPVESRWNRNLLRMAVEDAKVGGLLFSSGDLMTQAQMTNYAQKTAKCPLLITFDGEWGLSMRLKDTPRFPRNRILGSIENLDLIYKYGKEVARECKELGVHVNFAPVVDVDVNPKNPVINTRSFGDNPDRVAVHVLAYAAGLEENGVLSVAKHFPGHGDTEVDSHLALPLLPFTKARLDSVELYPFRKYIQANLGGIMVGHLQVPALAKSKLPASFSKEIVTNLLKQELKYKGLVFTDALTMKGVSGFSNVCLRALQAGCDLLLAPPAIKKQLDAVTRAVTQGIIDKKLIEEKCRKVLRFKYALGLANKPAPIQLSGLANRINAEQVNEQIENLEKAAVTLVQDKTGLIPLYKERDKDDMALLLVGNSDTLQTFQNELETHVSLSTFHVDAYLADQQKKQLVKNLQQFRRVLVAVSGKVSTEEQTCLKSIVEAVKVPFIWNIFASIQELENWADMGIITDEHALMLAHAEGAPIQKWVARTLFAKEAVNGRLPIAIKKQFASGQGKSIYKGQLPLYRPEEYGFSMTKLQQIDSIVYEGLQQKAFPGCQVVVLSKGRPIYAKCFGTHTGDSAELVKPTDLYDLASLTKTTATVLAMMRLYDEGRYNLTDPVAKYLPWLSHSNKKQITIKEVLMHQSGLPAGLVFYPEVIDKKSFKGDLFARKKDGRHTSQLGTMVWGNPNFNFKKEWVSTSPDRKFSLQVCDSLWLSNSFEDVVKNKIIEAPLYSKRYRYSDIGFILLRFLIERLVDVPMDVYLTEKIYEPMGLQRTLFKPLQKMKKEDIVPSGKDAFLRKQLLRGYVNDESCAFMGGVSGNAGLFSTASEVAQIYQMLIDGGVFNGKRILSEETCKLFVTGKSTISRRGLGFDRPDVVMPDKSPCCELAPASVFGHTGFTGTCAWADPEHDLVYVFLSNRTYPSPLNRKLLELDVRGRIQKAIYEAIF